MPNGNHSELYFHEWAAVVLIVGLIAMLAAISWMTSPPLVYERLGAPHHLVDPTVEVFVQGSVEHQGPLRVPRGSTIEDVLQKVNPLPEANLDRVNRLAKVRANQVIKIPAKKLRKAPPAKQAGKRKES